MANRKNPVGRPPKYRSKEEIQQKIDAYFRECDGEPYYDADGRPLVSSQGRVVYRKAPKPPTVTGLALALGFTTRTTLLKYQGKKEFMDTITRAKSKIEAYAEERLFDRDGVQGAKFSLMNNFSGWNEKREDETMTQEQDDPLTQALREEYGDGIF